MDLLQKKQHLLNLCDMLKTTYPDNVLYQNIDVFKNTVIKMALVSENTYKNMCDSISKALQQGLRIC